MTDLSTGKRVPVRVELSAEARPARNTSLQASYTYTNAIERNSALIGGTSLRLWLDASDLDGKYWNNACYTYSTLASNTYTLTATGVSTGLTAGIAITLTQDGNFTRTGM